MLGSSPSVAPLIYAAVRHGSGQSVGETLAIAVSAATIAGFVLSAMTYWIVQRRVRPVVICHEDRKRHIHDEGTKSYWVATVHLTNDGATTAFNIRLGLDMDGRHLPWEQQRGSSSEPDQCPCQWCAAP